MIWPTSDSMKWKKHCSSLNSKEQIKIRKAKRDHPSITMLPCIQATVSLLQYYLSCISRVCWALFSIPSTSYEAWKAKEGNCFLLPFAIGLQWLREVQELSVYISNCTLKMYYFATTATYSSMVELEKLQYYRWKGGKEAAYHECLDQRCSSRL